MKRQVTHRLTAILGAITLGAAGSASAMSGELYGYDVPGNQATPTVQASPSLEQSPYTSQQLRTWYHEGQKSRDEVRAELRAAREAGTLTANGDIGDTPAVLKARETFNANQREAIVAEYGAEQQRLLAEREAESTLMAFASEQSSDALAATSSYDEQMAVVDETLYGEPTGNDATALLDEPADGTSAALAANDDLPSDAPSNAVADTSMITNSQGYAAAEPESDARLAQDADEADRQAALAEPDAGDDTAVATMPVDGSQGGSEELPLTAY